ncbi:MAG: phage portal protein [Dehalococcoidia bacterium]|nr:phage portal protein [Dehalococcoidia bacterium]
MPITLPLPKQLERTDTERMKRYRDNLQFYEGNQWGAPTGNRQRRLTFNYAKVFIDKVASYMMSDIKYLVQPTEDTQEAGDRALRAHAALQDVHDANNMAQLDFDSEIDTSVLGDGCFKALWDADEKLVRIFAPDVQGIYAWPVAGDANRVWRVAHRYRLSREELDSLYGAAVVPTSSSNEATVVEVWTAREFQLWVDNELLEERTNEYGFIPFVLYPNLRVPKGFWGVSDIPPMVEPAQELNRALTQLSRILELSGNPIAVLENVDASSDIAVTPGAVWELPEKARAYLLDLLGGGGIKLHTDYIDLLYRALHDLSEAPRTAFGDNRQGLSGVALEMELHPLLQKVRRKRLVRGAAFRNRAEMILRLLEKGTGERFLPVKIEVVWGPVLPQDRSRSVADEVALVTAGIHTAEDAAMALGEPAPG